MNIVISMKCEKCNHTMDMHIQNLKACNLDLSFIKKDLVKRLDSNHTKGYHEKDTKV